MELIIFHLPITFSSSTNNIYKKSVQQNGFIIIFCRSVNSVILKMWSAKTVLVAAFILAMSIEQIDGAVSFNSICISLSQFLYNYDLVFQFPKQFTMHFTQSYRWNSSNNPWKWWEKLVCQRLAHQRVNNNFDHKTS